jgi:hypothetical protein
MMARVTAVPPDKRPSPEATLRGPVVDVLRILIDKYLDGLPLHRQRDRYRRLGMELAVSTLADQVEWCTDLRRPLWLAALAAIIDARVMLDGTGLPAQDAAVGATRLIGGRRRVRVRRTGGGARRRQHRPPRQRPEAAMHHPTRPFAELGGTGELAGDARRRGARSRPNRVSGCAQPAIRRRRSERARCCRTAAPSPRAPPPFRPKPDWPSSRCGPAKPGEGG